VLETRQSGVVSLLGGEALLRPTGFQQLQALVEKGQKRRTLIVRYWADDTPRVCVDERLIGVYETLSRVSALICVEAVNEKK